MNIFITGGAGDLGILLARALEANHEVPVRMDVRKPLNADQGQVIIGSILDRSLLADSMKDCEMVIHIAAWHGIHLVSQKKNLYDFWDLNVTGTFNVFEEAAKKGIKKIIYISSTSIEDRFGIYGHTKVLGEEIARTYHERHNMDVICLRPSAFIPYWNTDAYKSFDEWARWYWKGAVHINDVLQAVMKSLQILEKRSLPVMPILYVDGKYEYTSKDLASWNDQGSGSSFKKYYSAYATIADKYGLDKDLKPIVFDISETKKLLGYSPQYSFLNLLQDLEKYGQQGPPLPKFLKKKNLISRIELSDF